MDDMTDNENWSFDPWLVKRPSTSNNPPPKYEDVLPESSTVVGSAAIDVEIACSVDCGSNATEEGWVLYMEMLKSIAYGGLMVVIASFSVVAAAAAAHTPTVNMVALVVASVVGGIFAIGRNLWDLRYDCYKGEQEATNKYNELLGRLNYFPLHAVFAIVSFVVFGMVPPVIYGFAYRETRDKDYSIVAVTIVSLLCVSLLSIIKGCVTRPTTFVKSVVYNVATTVSISGVSYVIGILVSRLIEELGLFDGSLDVATTLLPHDVVPSLASF